MLTRTGTKLIIISLFIWIISIIVAISNFWAGFTIWVFSLIILAIGWSSNNAEDKRIKEADKRMKEQALVYFGADTMDDMTGSEFEIFLKNMFAELGYDVLITPTTGDYGVDLLMIKNDNKIAVQAKRHSNNIGNRAVQEVYAGMTHYDADEGWVVTNSYFTNSAIKQADSTKIKLIDRDDLMKYIVQAKTMIDENNAENQA